jgi:uncharacterized protein
VDLDSNRRAVRRSSIDDVPIEESDRRCHWPLGRRLEGHPGLTEPGC